MMRTASPADKFPTFYFLLGKRAAAQCAAALLLQPCKRVAGEALGAGG